jgi:hypothetical protein
MDMDEMNQEAYASRVERRHLEMMAATIASAVACPSVGMIAESMRDSIKAAQLIRDEQARAGTEGKA